MTLNSKICLTSGCQLLEIQACATTSGSPLCIFSNYCLPLYKLTTFVIKSAAIKFSETSLFLNYFEQLIQWWAPLVQIFFNTFVSFPQLDPRNIIECAFFFLKKKSIGICLWFIVVCLFETGSHETQAGLKLVAEAGLELPILLSAGITGYSSVPGLKPCFL